MATGLLTSSRSVSQAPQPTTTYAELVVELRRPIDPAAGPLELVRAATLAANSHNTQPWRFSLSEHRITIRPDPSRRCPVIDPDDHHTWASLGCAAENIVQAAPIFGYRAVARHDATAAALHVDLERGPSEPAPLAAAITSRQCTRSDYDGRALSVDDVGALAAAGTIGATACALVTDRAQMDRIVDLTVQGAIAQLRDPRFVAELVGWIRFNEKDALEAADGLFSRCSGNPTMPAWIGKRLLPFVMTERSEGDKLVKQTRSSAGLAVFLARRDDPSGWMEAGRAYQRFALEATRLGVRHAFVNQAAEVPALRAALAGLAGHTDRRPNLVVRFGRALAMPMSLRQPLGAVIDFY